MPSHDLTAVAIEIDDYMSPFSTKPVQEIELIRFSLQNILEETIQGAAQGILFRESFRRFILILHTADLAEAVTIAESCCVNINRNTRFTVSIGVGNPSQDISSLSESYQQAITALSYHFYTGGNAVFHYEAVQRKGLPRPAYSFEHEETLIFALQSGNYQMVLDTLNKLVDELQQMLPYPDPDQTVSIITVWASVIYRTLLECLPAAQLTAIEEQIQSLHKSPDISLHSLIMRLKMMAEMGCRLIQAERQHESQKIIQKAIAFIQTHIGEELTVDRCARVVSLSGGYFANLFKKETGTTFNQYVTHVRLDRAKKLLTQNVPVQDIAAELGYEHRRYFSDVFKKHTGMTPTEFKAFYHPE